MVVLKRPFADGASDVVLREKLNPEKPVALVDVPLNASLFAVVPWLKPVKLAFKAGSLAKMLSEPVWPLFSAVVPTIPVVRAADALAMPFSTCIVGCIKGFTAHVCVLNFSS